MNLIQQCQNLYKSCTLYKLSHWLHDWNIDIEYRYFIWSSISSKFNEYSDASFHLILDWLSCIWSATAQIRGHLHIMGYLLSPTPPLHNHYHLRLSWMKMCQIFPEIICIHVFEMVWENLEAVNVENVYTQVQTGSCKHILWS